MCACSSRSVPSLASRVLSLADKSFFIVLFLLCISYYVSETHRLRLDLILRICTCAMLSWLSLMHCLQLVGNLAALPNESHCTRYCFFGYANHLKS